MTAIATAIYEDDTAPALEARRHRRDARSTISSRASRSSKAPTPFTLERSVKGYRLNKFLHALIEPAWRAKFRADQEALFEDAGLTPEERDLVRTLNWRGMIHYGVSFFMLEKLGAVVGVSNLHIYAAMRGQSSRTSRRRATRRERLLGGRHRRRPVRRPPGTKQRAEGASYGATQLKFAASSMLPCPCSAPPAGRRRAGACASPCRSPSGSR